MSCRFDKALSYSGTSFFGALLTNKVGYLDFNRPVIYRAKSSIFEPLLKLDVLQSYLS